MSFGTFLFIYFSIFSSTCIFVLLEENEKIIIGILFLTNDMRWTPVF